MFKLESYITPIILSYVDKYVKNVKAERSQVRELSKVLSLTTTRKLIKVVSIKDGRTLLKL